MHSDFYFTIAEKIVRLRNVPVVLCRIVVTIKSNWKALSLDHLLSIFHRAKFSISAFPGVLKNWKQCWKIISRRSNGDLMNAGFYQAFLIVQTVRGNRWAECCQSNIVEMLHMKCCWWSTNFSFFVVVIQVAAMHSELIVIILAPNGLKSLKQALLGGKVFGKAESLLEWRGKWPTSLCCASSTSILGQDGKQNEATILDVPGAFWSAEFQLEFWKAFYLQWAYTGGIPTCYTREE